MARCVVISGIGMVTPLGSRPDEVLARIAAGERKAAPPPFDTAPFSCRVLARAEGFDADRYFPGNKTLRLMNRDAQMAVVAARLALQDASIKIDQTHAGEDVGLFGATGLSGLPTEEITRLVQLSAGPDGSLDLERFGQVALKRVRPVLSFKILANIPICFVSIFEGLRGENAVYTPWEGQGALAIAAGIRAIRHGRADCALVGGCDVKTHEFAFISLEQLGLFESWRRHGRGLVPGEGAAFLVLEDEQQAAKRGTRVYARVRDYCFRTVGKDQPLSDVLSAVVSNADVGSGPPEIVAAGSGDVPITEAEAWALQSAGWDTANAVRPKTAIGDLFAAAAPVQVGLAAELARRGRGGRPVLANCFGCGSEQAAFVLEAV